MKLGPEMVGVVNHGIHCPRVINMKLKIHSTQLASFVISCDCNSEW